MTDSLIIRPAVVADELAIARLWSYLMAELVRLDARQPRPTPGAERVYAARVVSTLDDPDTRVLIAESSGHVCGFILGAQIGQSDLFQPIHTGFIADLYVESGARRSGMGRALVEALRTWFVERGIERIALNVDSANTAGIAFWAAQGAHNSQIKMQIELDSSRGAP